jgi:SAM-dependent methyltransferase
MDILHKKQEIMNPMSEEKIGRLIQLLNLDASDKVLDIACGKGEFLIRLNEKYNIIGVGVDKSPYCIKDCIKKKQDRVPESDLKFIEMDGADYNPEIPESFDLSSCLGASWVFSGYRSTLKALSRMTKLGGYVVVGEPYWLREPSEAHLKAEKMSQETYGTHHQNVIIGEETGLRFLYTIVSNKDEWDQYETLHWWAAEEYVSKNPDDPDNNEILSKNEMYKEIYLKWGRDTLGWAIYVFKKPLSYAH